MNPYKTVNMFNGIFTLNRNAKNLNIKKFKLLKQEVSTIVVGKLFHSTYKKKLMEKKWKNIQHVEFKVGHFPVLVLS